jgi:hypothetical protein
VVTLDLVPPASPELLDIVCGDGGTLDAFCAGNPRFTECAEFIALHHSPGESTTFANTTVRDRRGDWVRGLQASEQWFMELVTPGERPDAAAIRVTCEE